MSLFVCLIMSVCLIFPDLLFTHSYSPALLGFVSMVSVCANRVIWGGAVITKQRPVRDAQAAIDHDGGRFGKWPGCGCT